MSFFPFQLNEEQDVAIDIPLTRAHRTKDMCIMYSVNSGTETRKIARIDQNFEPFELIEKFVNGHISWSDPQVKRSITYMLHNGIPHYRP